MTSPSYHIEKLVHGGLGLSRSEDGQTTLIEGVISGETVTAKIQSTGRKHNKGVATSIIHPSPERIQAPCPHYKQCGGCDFQHMTYPCQLQEKHQIIKELLEQSGNSVLQKSAEILLTAPLASQQQLHYRQRIRLQVDDKQVLGFHKRRSRACVAIDNCLLAVPAINDCLQKLLPQHPFSKLLYQTEALEILYDPNSSTISILLHFKRKPRPTDKQHALKLMDGITGLKNIFFTGLGFAVTGLDSLSFTLPPFPPHTSRPLQLSLETGGFCQVNVEQNEALVRTVLGFCLVTKEDSVLDLFCGMGNFSVPLAEQAESVLGIEGQGSAIRSAIKNSSNVGQDNTEFLKQPIHGACAELAKADKTYDCIVIDPPRQGAPGLARILDALCKKRLVYVSCDPATLCRDLTDLLHQGFILKKLQPIDMFPQTHHIETVALLEKSSEKNHGQ
jgi:23S rRNA (uracil1939-C5)-methyltransferase